MSLTSQSVAVIGAGASGLAAAKELRRREGHAVVVFERGSQLGGTWVYSPQPESDPMGLDPNRKVVHSSVYQSLRTNFPREIMSFTDFPFVATEDPGRDPRRYPSHEEVLRYLEDFALKFNLNELVRYETEVKHVVELENGKFKVISTSWRGKNESEVEETFDAVIVCTGHYTQPHIPEIPGIETWPGKQIHSHNYRVPKPYSNLVVLVIGGGFSAGDISRELATVAKEVHVAYRSDSSIAFGKQPSFDNMWFHPMVASANEDGTLTFEDGSTVFANVIMHCTGYEYAFPFLRTIDVVTIDDNRVGPLYKHVFPPTLAPKLSFVGISWKVIPFIQYELQSKWIVGALSGRIALPSKEKMREDVEAFYSKMDETGVPKRYTHMLGELMFEYFDWLATQCGCAPVEEWRRQMAWSSLKMIIACPESFRDNWDDGVEFLMSEAQKDFARYLTDTKDAYSADGTQPKEASAM